MSKLKLMQQCPNSSQNLYVNSPNQSDVARNNKRSTDALINSAAAASVPWFSLWESTKLTNRFSWPPKERAEGSISGTESQTVGNMLTELGGFVQETVDSLKCAQ